MQVHYSYSLQVDLCNTYDLVIIYDSNIETVSSESRFSVKLPEQIYSITCLLTTNGLHELIVFLILLSEYLNVLFLKDNSFELATFYAAWCLLSTFQESVLTNNLMTSSMSLRFVNNVTRFWNKKYPKFSKSGRSSYYQKSDDFKIASKVS